MFLVYATKAYMGWGGVEVYLHSFLTSARDLSDNILFVMIYLVFHYCHTFRKIWRLSSVYDIAHRAMMTKDPVY